MLINNIIQKTLNKKNINVVSSHCDDKKFNTFINKILDGGINITAEDMIYAHFPVHLVLCNSRSDSLDKCVKLSQYFHTPLLIVDHDVKPEYIESHKISKPRVTYTQIALSENIAHSWNIDLYHHILHYDITSKENINKWKEILQNLISLPFKVDNNNEKDSTFAA